MAQNCLRESWVFPTLDSVLLVLICILSILYLLGSQFFYKVLVGRLLFFFVNLVNSVIWLTNASLVFISCYLCVIFLCLLKKLGAFIILKMKSNEETV